MLPPPFTLLSTTDPSDFPQERRPLPPDAEPPTSASYHQTIEAPPAPAAQPPAPRRSRWPLVAILGVTLVGLWLAPTPSTELVTATPTRGLFDAALRSSPQVRDVFRSPDPASVEAHVRSVFNRSVGLPTLRDAMLLGAGELDLAGVDLPVFLFEMQQGQTVHVLGLSYAVLDAHPQVLSVAPPVLSAVVDGTHVERLGRESAVLWRERDKLYLVLTEDPASITRRIVR